MKRKPTNVALTPELQRRVRILAAKFGVRQCAVVERALNEALPQMELQALANENTTEKVPL